MRITKVAVVLAAVSMLVTGVWGRLDPAGFAEWANWPNHQHFLHDAGVFQIGIGLMMLLALWWRDAIAVVLTGFIVTNTFHALNHVLDAEKGGNASDPWLLLVVSVIAAVGLWARLRSKAQAKAEETAA